MRLPIGILFKFINSPDNPNPLAKEYDGKPCLTLRQSSWDEGNEVFIVRFDDGKETGVPAKNLVAYEGRQFHWYEEYNDMPSYTAGFADFGVGYRMAHRLARREDKPCQCILTDQVSIMTAKQLDNGCRLFLHFHNTQIVEIKYGMEMPVGERLDNNPIFWYDFPYMITHGDFAPLSD